jgi:hypothetical protein
MTNQKNHTDVTVDKLSWEWYERPRYPMPDTQTTLRMGKWDLGFVGYDWTTAAPRGCRHVAYISLPGIKQEQGHYGSVRQAKEVVERVVRYWFYHLILRGNVEEQHVKRVRRARAEEQHVVRVRRTRPEPTRLRRAPRVG